MDKDLPETTADFLISVGALWGILNGHIPGGIGMAGITIIMSFNLSTAVKAYQKVQQNNGS